MTPTQINVKVVMNGTKNILTYLMNKEESTSLVNSPRLKLMLDGIRINTWDKLQIIYSDDFN